jgi:hypothetical protein
MMSAAWHANPGVFLKLNRVIHLRDRTAIR